ncbi:Scr1 family TA system antitoxin-like transcriptional regulator [Nocardia asiatica]|uniref:Scr1 family TA system antitoxin-like transcriptional regulator n=1 Tax=Nocardia asiatica TaxID=209252 RepID=UPI003EE0FC67
MRRRETMWSRRRVRHRHRRWVTALRRFRCGESGRACDGGMESSRAQTFRPFSSVSPVEDWGRGRRRCGADVSRVRWRMDATINCPEARYAPRGGSIHWRKRAHLSAGEGSAISPPIVYLETFTACTYLERASDVQRYYRVHDSLQQASLDETASRGLIRQVLKELSA